MAIWYRRTFDLDEAWLAGDLRSDCYYSVMSMGGVSARRRQLRSVDPARVGPANTLSVRVYARCSATAPRWREG